MFGLSLKKNKKPIDVHELPYSLHLGNLKQMGVLVGRTELMNLRQGHNKIEDMFYVQITHKETKDQMRIWLDMDEFASFVINCRQVLAGENEKKTLEEAEAKTNEP